MNLKKVSIFSTVASLAIVGGVSMVFATNDTYLIGDEIYTKAEVLSIEPQDYFVPEVNFSDEIPEIELDYSDLEDYIVEEQTGRAVYSLTVKNYIYESYSSLPQKINVSMQSEGYTYTGTLTLGDYIVSGNKYIGYYSGTLYR